MALRERLDGLSRAELTGLIVVVALALAGAGLWYARSLPRPIQVATAGPATGRASGATGATAAAPASPAAPVIVDVAGWVRTPGVYEFSSGDRIVDAIARAGGARRGADLAALNLAAPLVDGTQILVPREGEAPPAGVVGAVATGGAAGGLVNINTASATELEALPGIGEVLAATIVAYRDEHGPFASVDQLEDVSGIGPSTLEELRDLVTI
ncbi:MAG TPA: ComEA family DNA-binding protein [Actinomycetota bacterium]|jgi:competence protein ComEA